MQELLRRYDPYPPQNIRTVTDYQNEILDLFDDARHEGEESKGRRYIRWRFIRGLKKDLTPNLMEKNSSKHNHIILHEARLLVSVAEY